MNDLSQLTIHHARDVAGYDMLGTDLINHMERLEAENRRLLRGIEVISALGGGEGKRLARLILAGADTHAWWIGQRHHGGDEGR
jgi:hypothetical protein